MRPLWKGFISFGLVSIPVKLFPATESKNISFSMLHKDCASPIHYRKYCEHCDKTVPPEEIIKGYEFSKDKYVTFTDEEMEEISADGNRQIEITDFVNLDEVDPIYFHKSYYIAPGDGGEKPYALLLSALKASNRIAVAKLVLRTKENIAMLRVYHDDTIALSTVYFPNEIRNTNLLEIAPDVQVKDVELDMAKMLIDNLTHPFDPEKYKDEYRETLNEVIEKKILNEKVEYSPDKKAPSNIIDLTEALKQSLEKLTKDEPKKEKSVKKKPVKSAG